MKPRIFISAVTKELRSARQLVANTLVAMGYEPVWQDIFDTSGEDIRAMLRNKIDSCSAVLQIVGEAYGAEPRAPDEKFGRVSYTQYEALYARSISKKVYYLIASNDLPRDAKPELIDLPRDDSDAARGDADRRRQLQRDYLASIQSTGHIYYAVQSNPETELAVRRLKDELDKLRRGFRNWMIGVSVGLIGIALGIAWLSGGIQNLLTLITEGQKKTEERIVASSEKNKEELKDVIETAVKELTNPSVLAERIRKEIHATTEAKIDLLPDEQGRGRKIAEIEKERDLALGRVDDLIKLIQEGLKEGASPVFQRAADILQKEGTNEALAYLESRRQATLDDARRHADQAKASQAKAESEKELRNKTLRPLILEAELLESKLQWEAALKLREQVAELAPDWFEARNMLGLLYLNLAQFQKAELHLQATLQLGKTADEEATALGNLASLLKAMNRLTEAEPLMRRALAIGEQSFGVEHPNVAIRLNNLAQLLQETNRVAEAEPLMRRALAIDEQAFGTEHTDVARDLNNLAGLLMQTNRLAEAELLFRRAMTIDTQWYNAEHPNVSRLLNNLASLLEDTNRREEAEPLWRHALAIDEQAFGTEHPSVALMLNNLAALLNATNRLAEAEPLWRRALAIDEQVYGTEHPRVASDISNLASLLKDTTRLAEAEPLMRRALAIDKLSYGAEHPDVAIRLGNLARLLQATNRLKEAEPLMRRALAIDEQSYGAEHPEVAIKLSNLADLLKAMNRLAEAEPLMQRTVTISKLFQKKTNFEHPGLRTVFDSYARFLVSLKLPKEEVEEKLNAVKAAKGPLTPIVPEVERLLGPSKSAVEVLVELDRQYKDEGRPSVYFLEPEQPIAPHLDSLLKPNATALVAFGVRAFRNKANADAILLYDEALSLLEDKAATQQLRFSARMNRCSALRELGAVAQARDELLALLPELDGEPSTPGLTRGRARFHLASSEWRLGDKVAAMRAAEESAHEYEIEAAKSGLSSDLAWVKSQTEQLLVDLKEDKPPPPLPTPDPKIEIESARARFRARARLATLSLKESAVPLLDQILGPPKSTKEVFDTLDQQYREQGKPAVWFLPLSEPITSHLDQLLGPVDTPDPSSKTNL